MPSIRLRKFLSIPSLLSILLSWRSTEFYQMLFCVHLDIVWFLSFVLQYSILTDFLMLNQPFRLFDEKSSSTWEKFYTLPPPKVLVYLHLYPYPLSSLLLHRMNCSHGYLRLTFPFDPESECFCLIKDSPPAIISPETSVFPSFFRSFHQHTNMQ